MIRILLGGSPCTFWSIAQKQHRETQASGLGWELFKNYLIAKDKFKPDYFLYENNVSAAQPIKCEIRNLLNVYDGTFLMPYSDVRYIEINSALVSAQSRERFYVHNCGAVKQPKDRGISLKDVLESGLSVLQNAHGFNKGGAHSDKCPTLTASPSGAYGNQVVEPVRVGTMPQSDGTVSESKQWRIYGVDGKSTALCANGGDGGAKTGLYAVPLERYNYATEFDSEGNPTKAYCYADGKIHTVYVVKNGKITIKGKEYNIKLPDMFCIIRKLTVAECRRLQTIPDWYKMPCSDTQNYKMLGNGWTVEVIKHILSHIPNITTEPIEVLSMYDGMSCGQIALKELGANVVRYYATEIDKPAIQTTLANFPDTMQLGDAFQVRDSHWYIGL